MSGAVPGLTVLVTWWELPPPQVALAELEQAVEAVPRILQLSALDGWRGLPERVRRRRRRFRLDLARRGRKTGRALVKVRGGTRFGRAVVRLTAAPPSASADPYAARLLGRALPDSGPTLLVVTDHRSARAAWEVGRDVPGLVAVLGLGAAGRLVEAVGAAGVPWADWGDVAGDVDPDHLYAALPGPAGGEPIAPHELRDVGSEPLVLPAPPAEAGPALLVAPANYAGQGAAWVRALGRHEGRPAANLHVVRAGAPFSFAADHPVTEVEWPLPAVRRRIAAEAVGPATHVLVEALRPVLDLAGTATSAWDFEAGARDVAALRHSGRTVAVLLHGSESRRPAEHAERYPHSPFRGRESQADVARLVSATDTVHRLLGELPDVPRFVSTPDMLDFVPGARWLPVVVRESAFEPGVAVLARRLPVVLHAPSSPLMKGSDVVDEVLGRLQEEGVVEYRRLREVPPALVADHVRDADLVVDQVALGNLGVLALEAMACGRVVLGHALPEVLSRYGETVPLVVVDPVALREQVLGLLADREQVGRLAQAGPGFVRRHHDGARSAAVLASFLAGR